MTPTRPGQGGRAVLYAFGWEDLSALLGVGTHRVRQLINDGIIDPQDLGSVTSYWHQVTCGRRLLALGRALDCDGTYRDAVTMLRDACGAVCQ